jgi:ABC-type Fe3+/spermidine/putrescine transport system ATPase subunit
MRLELKELQKRVGVTTLFVTHDQAEAMILSDRVFVMNGGRIAQDGSPRQIYEHPRTRFVMDFLGQVDHVDACVARTPDGAYVARPDGVQGARPIPLATDQPWRDGEPVVLALRSSDVRVCAVDSNGSWQGTILSTMYLGERIEYVVRLGAAQVRAWGPVTDSFSAGATVQLQIPPGAIRAWPTRP